MLLSAFNNDFNIAKSSLCLLKAFTLDSEIVRPGSLMDIRIIESYTDLQSSMIWISSLQALASSSRLSSYASPVI